VKALLADLSAEHRAVKGNLLHALAHVVPSHLLDRDLHRAVAQATGRDPWLDGDDEDCGQDDVVKLATRG
jgi:tRNA 2-thiocytidine biosynthesis protein TtcA